MYSAAISANLWRVWLFRLALRFLIFIEETLPDRGAARLQLVQIGKERGDYAAGVPGT